MPCPMICRSVFKVNRAVVLSQMPHSCEIYRTLVRRSNWRSAAVGLRRTIESSKELTFETVEAIDKILILLFDTLIFLLTMQKTWSQVQQATSTGINVSYSQLLLRDGESSSSLDLLLALSHNSKCTGTTYFLWVHVRVCKSWCEDDALTGHLSLSIHLSWLSMHRIW